MRYPDLERQFTSMLVRTDTLQAYANLCGHYIRCDADFKMLSEEDQQKKLESIRDGDPKEWITKIFTEGLDIPPLLYRINTLWLRRLGETAWT